MFVQSNNSFDSKQYSNKDLWKILQEGKRAALSVRFNIDI